MSVFNGEQYLRSCIDSILAQTLCDFEFIIINDGSTDRSTEILRHYAKCDARIKLIEHHNLGLTKSLNIGLKLAQGEFVARMDADDIAHPERFQLQVSALRANPELVMVGGDVELVTENMVKLGLRSQGKGHYEIRRRLLLGDGGAMTHPAVTFRRQAALDIGGYDERFKYAQDLDFFLRLSEIGLVENLETTVLYWRQHEQSINRTQSSTWKDLKILAITNTLARIGPKRFAEELFQSEHQFWFPQGYFELGQFAMRNNRRKEARHFFWMAIKHGVRRRKSFESLVYLNISAAWRLVLRVFLKLLDKFAR